MNELEQRWRDLGEFIREQRRIGHLSLRKLSEMAGISNPYLSQIERGLRKPSAEILQQIARALEISSETLYVRAGILEEREGDHDVVGEIRRDPYISEDQKKTLIHIYESFAAETRAARGEEALEDLESGGNAVASPAGSDASDDGASDNWPADQGQRPERPEPIHSVTGNGRSGADGPESAVDAER